MKAVGIFSQPIETARAAALNVSLSNLLLVLALAYSQHSGGSDVGRF